MFEDKRMDPNEKRREREDIGYKINKWAKERVNKRKKNRKRRRRRGRGTLTDCYLRIIVL